MKYLKYLKYIMRHKWFVFLGCLKLGKGNSWFWPLLFFGIVHDWSKFRPSELFPYVDWFYDFFGSNWSQEEYGGCEDEIRLHDRINKKFDLAWLYHQHRNKHHWQAWLLQEDDGDLKKLNMPHLYLLEMVADWYGAGRAISGQPKITPWYETNKDKILISGRTREVLETVIKNLDKKQ